jgi:alpha-galactosidase
MNYFHLPYFNQAVASDPTSSKQVRMKRKAYAAMAPQMAYYGDHVELTDGGTDFASQIGTGAVIGSKFTYPKDNPNVKPSFLLTPEKEELIRHWMKIYKEKDLARGEYINLYTWGYDYPEAHVIKQNDALYYAFYTDAEAFQG